MVARPTFLIFALALVVRLSYCWLTGSLGVSPKVNYREAVIVATELLRQGQQVCPLAGDGSTIAPSVFVPPAYVRLVAAVYWAMGVETTSATLTLQIINCAALAGACALIYLAAQQLVGSMAALIAGVISFVHPLLIGYAPLIWDTSLFVLGVAGAVYLSIRLSRRPAKFKSFLLFGMYLGVLALINPALTVGYPVLVLYPLIVQTRCGFDKPSSIKKIAAALLGWGLLIAPWTLRNYLLIGELLYIRGNFWHEVWLGVCPEADENPSAVFDSRFALRNSAERERLVRLGEKAYMAECKAAAIRAIRQDPARFGRLAMLRTIDFWTGTVLTHRSPLSSWRPASAFRAVVMYWLWIELIVIAASLLVMPRLWWLVLLAGLFSATYVLTHVELRFRAPIEPVLMLVVGATIAQLSYRRIKPTPGVQCPST